MFYALAIVCDDYFVPSLEKISEVSEQRVLAGRRKAQSVTLGYFFNLSEPAAQRGCGRGHVHGRWKLCSGALHLSHWLVALNLIWLL